MISANNPMLYDLTTRSHGSKQTALRIAGATVAERIILRALTKMRRGCLRLSFANGRSIQIGQPGQSPSAEIHIRDQALFRRLLFFGDIGLGEGYMDGQWETPDITAVISWFIVNLDNSPLASDRGGRPGLVNIFEVINRLQHLLRPNTKRTARRNISDHYDLGNDFYKLWLDRSMTYSSGIFTSDKDSLEKAQAAKYEALCEALHLCADDRVLEIGSGWGGFCSYAARTRGCQITSITISKEQAEFATQRMRMEGLSDKVEIRLCDYRDVTGSFDKIVSIEMMEAVGHRFLPTYFAALNRLLTREGLVALQFITIPDSKYEMLRRHVDFIQKHIFPGSLLLSLGRINDVLRRTGNLCFHTISDYGQSYARTLSLWRKNFNEALSAVRKLGFDERFIRKWNYYLSYCEAGFTMRNISVVQAVLTRPCNTTLVGLP